MNTDSMELKRMVMLAVVGYVGDCLAVSSKEIMSKRRDWTILDARQLALYIIFKTQQISLSDIARFFKMTHTTVGHAVEKIEDMLAIGDYTISTKYGKCLHYLNQHTK